MYETAVVTRRRFSLNMIEAISPRGEFRFMLHDGSVNAEAFRKFIKRRTVGTLTTAILFVDSHFLNSYSSQLYGCRDNIKCLPKSMNYIRENISNIENHS
jgi:hypothetical protein